MKLSLLILACASLPLFSQAQLGNKILNKIKNKASQRADARIDKQIDKTLDEIEGKGSSTSTSPEPQSTPKSNDLPATEAKTAIKSFGKYDFVPGEQVIYSNDFATDNIGELPTGWNTGGNGAVTTLNTQKGNWLQLFQTSTFLSDNTATFTDNFTVEFDLILRFGNPKSAFPQLAFGVMSSGDQATTDNDLLRYYEKYFATELKLQPGTSNSSHMHYETFVNGHRYLNTDVKNFGKLEKLFDQPIHVAMQIQKERLRLWFNEDKMYDLPKAIPAETLINQLFFRVKSSNAKDEATGYSISNIKIAKGLPDTRHKLVEEGKFSTTGILFDVNSATIKPESAGVIREIGEVLKKFPDIKVKIIGHTDSDGSDAVNLELSKKRAAAVRQALSDEAGIDVARMETDGKGEKESVGDNKTREGKAQNRRVEFIKM
jgi:OmpA-OmpF porin, OOP family